MSVATTEVVVVRVYKDGSSEGWTRSAVRDGDLYHVQGSVPWDEDPTPTWFTTIDGRHVTGVTQWPDRWTAHT